MSKNNEYYFDDVRELIHYLFSNYGNLSPLKLQKGLYFLFAYYGALYGNKQNSSLERKEVEYDYPKFLFNANFEAWDYGPVIRDVYFENKRGEYSPYAAATIQPEEVFGEDVEVRHFVKEIFDQVVETSDFSLVDRSHEDIAWKKIHDAGEVDMSNEEIVNEYSQEYI